MATTICSRRATLTSASVSTSYTVGATTRKVVATSPARTYLVPYTATTCVTRVSTRVCAPYITARYSIAPAQVYTTDVVVHTQRTIYITNRATLYSTSCTVSRRPTLPPAPAPTPPPRPVTSYITVGTTTTKVSVFYPSQSTVDGSSGGDVPTDIPGPVTVDGGGTASARKAPVGAIVGGVLGGLVAAALLGFLIFFLLFKKAKRDDQDTSREHPEHQRPLSTLDGHSSPSEGSSGILPQMQEYGAQYGNVAQYGSGGQYGNGYGGQGMQAPHNMTTGPPGHQYTHVRQDSMVLGGADQVSPVSSPGPGTDQGHYYPRGHYVGHAEIQDSRF